MVWEITAKPQNNIVDTLQLQLHHTGSTGSILVINGKPQVFKRNLPLQRLTKSIASTHPTRFQMSPVNQNKTFFLHAALDMSAPDPPIKISTKSYKYNIFCNKIWSRFRNGSSELWQWTFFKLRHRAASNNARKCIQSRLFYFMV